MSFSPILSLSLLSPLIALILSTVVWFFRAMPHSVSPWTTTCVPPPPEEGFFGVDFAGEDEGAGLGLLEAEAALAVLFLAVLLPEVDDFVGVVFLVDDEEATRVDEPELPGIGGGV